MYRKQNRILAAMYHSEWRCWQDKLELVELGLGEVLYSAEAPLNFLYFPLDSIVTLGCDDGEGETEFSLIGNEGVVGAFAFLGNSAGICAAKVERAGKAYRVPIEFAVTEFSQSSEFRTLILNHMQSLVAMALQSAICISSHTPLQRVCRALLRCDDRVLHEQTSFELGFIAGMAGLGIEQVQGIAAQLTGSDSIELSRLGLKILNRGSLEKTCCDCYVTLQEELERLLPPAKGVDGIDATASLHLRPI